VANDLTARARIRDAAISHFADEGYERATIRGIAATAGVSPGLLRHHFGSKEELRRACDEHIAETLRRVNAQYLEDLSGAAVDRRLVQPFERYIVRALAENSPSAAPIFDEMVTMTERWLERADDALARNMADSVAGSWIGGMIDYAIRNSPQRPTTCQATATATDPNGATGTGSATVPVGMTTTQIDIADQTPGTTWAVGDIDHLNVQVTCADGRGNSQVAKATLDQDALAAG